ncbi:MULTISPECIES: hypothetical protein [Calothrix]|uniref:Uncharacterized protein n=2 Tax=Calothrix TaxID=1186 RepID=A0ABR8AAF1_9CYAN|nr:MULTISPECIES: hypothetical protein [Calothrix]MBD2196829.1 hypothetical protein [Calothrix parietina FACHB-288]MBD2225381.1 hypothetical protein [Calothrix anomala FACHB-343]
MITNILTLPKFSQGQKVVFIGGEGIIKNYRPESDSWVYLVEMPLKQQNIDRVGYETMLWLSESDLQQISLA